VLKTLVLLTAVVLVTSCANTNEGAQPSMKSFGSSTEPTWNMNATIIEACSCPMFCQCYFNSVPAGPGCCSTPDDPLLKTRFCRFNNAFRVNRGSHAGTKLDGAKFWVAGDLGDEFSDGEMNWAVLHFDPSVTKAQRDGITTIIGHVYPVKWQSLKVGADAPIEWRATRDHAEAKLDGGKLGEVRLKKNQGMTDDPIVMHNLRYWGTPRNDGFVMMANEVERYSAGDQSFEFKGTNGFMITFDITSKDAGGATAGTY
jgi:hypothetical protein